MTAWPPHQPRHDERWGRRGPDHSQGYALRCPWGRLRAPCRVRQWMVQRLLHCGFGALALAPLDAACATPVVFAPILLTFVQACG